MGRHGSGCAAAPLQAACDGMIEIESAEMGTQLTDERCSRDVDSRIGSSTRTTPGAFGLATQRATEHWERVSTFQPDLDRTRSSNHKFRCIV